MSAIIQKGTFLVEITHSWKNKNLITHLLCTEINHLLLLSTPDFGMYKNVSMLIRIIDRVGKNRDSTSSDNDEY